jgi:uncharacterized protein
MKPWIFIVWMCVAVTACSGAAETTPPSRKSLRLARTTAGDLKPALARIPDVNVEIVSEGGSSITSLIDLQSRKVDVTVPLADVAYLAYAGGLEGMPHAFDNLRGMAVTDVSTMHFLVRPGVKVRSLRDLKGLRVSLGAPNSSTSLMTPRLLQAHGIPLSEVRTERNPNVEMLTRLASGDIDAAFSSYNVPNQGVITAMKAGVRLLDIAGPIVEEMRTRYPYLKRTLIAGGTYPNQPEPVHTIGIDVVMACRADLDEDVAYRLLDAYFATRPAATPPNLERAPATPIPLHPGAARYYRQRELSR